MIILYDIAGVNLTNSESLLKDGDYNCNSNIMVDGDIFTYPFYFVRSRGHLCTVKILQPMTPIQNYFEYQITCSGVICEITIGLVGRNYPLNRHPGWNKEGIGYHADDGNLFCGQSNQYQSLGPTCTAGDRMGCGVDFEGGDSPDYVNVFFTKNGQQVGGFINFKKPKGGLFPLIGMDSRGEQFQYLGRWNYLPKEGKLNSVSLYHVRAIILLWDTFRG